MNELTKETTWKKPLKHYEDRWDKGECEACLQKRADLIWDLKEDRMVCLVCARNGVLDKDEEVCYTRDRMEA